MSEIDSAIRDFKVGLAGRVRHYLKVKGITQRGLASRIEVTEAAVNQSLNDPEGRMTDKFVGQLSRHLPEFWDSYGQLRRLEDSRYMSPEDQAEAIENAKSKADLLKAVDQVAKRLEALRIVIEGGVAVPTKDD